MPSVAAAAHGPVQVGLTGTLMKPAVPQVPGGFASPCAPGGKLVMHAAPPLHWLAAPDVQNDRSPCLAASIATVTMPAAAYESATDSMSARPRPSPCRNSIRGAHLPNGARSPVHAGTLGLLAFGVAISTWIGVTVPLVGSARNAPVNRSTASSVPLSTSRISFILLDGTRAASTRYLVNAALAVSAANVMGSCVAAGSW